MSKFLSGLCISFILVSVSMAQLVHSFGIRGGLVQSNQKWDYSGFSDLKSDNYYGLYLGMCSEFMDFKYLSLVVDAAYNQKGMRLSINRTMVSPNEQGYIDIGTIHYKNRFDYLTVSGLFELKYPTALITPYLILGPRIDFLVNKRIEMFRSASEEFDEINVGYSYGIGLSYHKLDGIVVSSEIINSPDLDNLYEREYLTVSKYSYEFLLGIHFELDDRDE